MYVRSNIITVCLLVFTIADGKKLQKEVEPQDWYADFVKSQDHPLIMRHVKELGKKISLARGGGGWGGEGHLAETGGSVAEAGHPVPGLPAAECPAVRPGHTLQVSTGQ